MPLETPEQVLAVLAATPRRLAEVAAGADRALERPPAPGEWSAREVLAHLRACSDVWGGCIERLLHEDAPSIRAVNPRTWIEQTDYGLVAFPEHLAAFAAQRRDLLAVLQPLAPEQWRRSGVVTGAGRPLERTVLSYAAWLASHERPHVRQVERAVRESGGAARG